MYQGKRILAIIPARSGSKGVPDKNIKPLCGKPLMAYAIEAALKSGIVDNVFVSTDSRQYADIAREFGAEVPFLRPDTLASDQSLACEYIVHTINSYYQMGDAFDYFVVLQPTSPMRTSKHIFESVQILTESNAVSVVSVCPASHPAACYGYISKDGNLEGFSVGRGINRQAADKLYHLNGAIYLCNCKHYLEHQSFYGLNSKAYIMDKVSSIDIDTQFDFDLAEWIMRYVARINA